MSSTSAHPNDEELEVAAAEMSAGGELSGGVPAAWRTHVQDCAICKDRILQLSKATEELRQLRRPNNTRSLECLSQEEWFEVVAGTKSPNQELKALQHASGCDQCGAALRLATELVGTEAPHGAEALASQAQSGTSLWRHSMAVRLAENQTYRQSSRKSGRVVWILVPLVSVLTLFAVFATYKRDPDKTAALIAQGYEARRLFEPRMPLAGPAPMASVQRGASSGTPASIYEALALVEKHLQQDPHSPLWLDLKGRAELVGGNLDAAIEVFTRALNQAGDDKKLVATIDADYAAALSSRASIEGSGPQRGQDLRDAKQHILQAVEANLNDPVVLFNKALIEKQIGEWNNAATTLETFLETYPTDKWAGEARRILQELKAKISLHQTPVPSSPEEFMKAARSFVPEAYLDVALRQWLPERGHSRNLEAFKHLAVEFEKTYGDRWLADLVNQRPDSAALGAIASAILANGLGSYYEAIRDSQYARRLIVPAQAPAAFATAAFQEVYARQLLYQGRRCVEEGARLNQFLISYPQYRWLRTQTLLELAVCNNFIGELSHANNDVRSALEIARSSGFRVVRLRAMGLQATLERQQGNAAMAWELCTQGLQSYWPDWAPPQRAHQFLTEIAAEAETEGQWSVAVPLQLESVRVIETDEDLDYVAVTRFRLARMAQASGNAALAADQFREAEALFSKAPDPESVRVHRLESMVGLAAILGQLGKRDECRRQIETIRPFLQVDDPYYLTLRFYEVMGDLELSNHELSAAESAYSNGIRIAERALKTIGSRSDRLRWMAETDHSYRSLTGVLAETGKPETAWELWQRHTGSFATPKPLRSAANLQTASRTEAAGDAYLSFVRTGRGIAGWMVVRGRTYFRWLNVAPEQLNRTASRLTRLSSDPASAETAIAYESRLLYDWLLAPMESHLAGVWRLVLQPDSTTPDFPFELLQDSHGRLMTDRFVISYSPTLNILRGRAAKVSSTQDRFVFLHGSETGVDSHAAAPLSNIDDEAKDFQSKFRKVEIIDTRTTGREAVAAHLRAANVVHFSGHGVSWLSGSGLVLSSSPGADAVMITPDSIDRLGTSVTKKFVFLAACSTARGTERSLLDANSLVLSFILAGAQTVIASRWAVDSQATGELTAAFYSQISEGKPPAEALSLAMTAARRRHSHPYYWAGFSTFEGAL